MLIDAHFHADDLYEKNSLFINEYRQKNIIGIASVHSLLGLEKTKKIIGNEKHLISFGLHPQLPIMEEAENLKTCVQEKLVDAIGECGFDFFNLQKEKNNNSKLMKSQRQVFEFQLELAIKYSLPMIIHLRKANNIIFEYTKKLSVLPAVIFHSWPGPGNEAIDMLKKVPQAFFSFGLQTANGNKKVLQSLKSIPESAILSESDAPYQALHPNNTLSQTEIDEKALLRGYSQCDDVQTVVEQIAKIKSSDYSHIKDVISKNFCRIFPQFLV